MIRAAVSRVLSEHFGEPVSVFVERHFPDRSFSVVARVRATVAPGTFVVKAAEPSAPTGVAQLFNDWAGLRLLTELADSAPGRLDARGAGDDVPLAPRLYGGDRDVPLVVMEDLGSGDGSPAGAVDADDPDEATASLLAYVRVIARLHARTRGHRDRWLSIRSDLGPRPSPKALYHDPWSDAASRAPADVAAAVREYHAVLSALGVTAVPGVDDEIVAVSHRVELNPTPFLALCQGDQNGLGHCLRADGRLRLHDFGSGGFRHALVEGMPHRITWGGMRRVPEGVAAAMDTAYRDELLAGWPDVSADLYNRAIADAFARWHVFHVVHRVPDALAGDRPRGRASLRQQVLAWLGAYPAWSERRGLSSALARTAVRVMERLRSLWPPDTHAIDYWPAYAHISD